MDKNITQPIATVLMPVYNGGSYLKEAIDSILNQTFTDFEFLIVNDGSTDNTEKIIKSYNDPRIRLVNNDTNIGLIKSLNKGISLSNGKYIIRMDADDISLPNRLAIQINYMENNLETGVAGTYFSRIGSKKIKKNPYDPETLKISLLFYCAIGHPTVIIRKNFLEKYNLLYDENYPHAEDYELWTKAIKHFPISNIKKKLLLYRVHENNVSKLENKKQIENGKKIIKRELKNNLKIDPSEEDLNIHYHIKKPKEYKINYFIDKKREWLLKLSKKNNKILYYKKSSFDNFVSFLWIKTCKNNLPFNINLIKKLWNLPVYENRPFKKILILNKYIFKYIFKL